MFWYLEVRYYLLQIPKNVEVVLELVKGQKILSTINIKRLVCPKRIVVEI